MADSDFTYIPDAQPDQNTEPTWGDYGKTFVANGASTVLAPLAADVRAATDRSQTNIGIYANEMAKTLQGYFNEKGDEVDESRTEVAKKRAAATITDPEFWDHPVSSAALKLTGMAPGVAAALFSGGAVGAAVVGGALAGGAYLNELDKELDKASDADLQKNDYYRVLRQAGESEDDARLQLKSKLIGNKALLNFVGGAVAGALGPAGKLAAGTAGKAAIGLAGDEAGAMARAAYGAGEGAAGGMLQSGIADATTQQGQVDLGLKKKIDIDALAGHVLEGGWTTALAGAAGGALAKGKAKAAKGDRPSTDIEENDRVPDPNQTAPKQGSGDQDTAVQTQTPGGTTGSSGGIAPTASPPEGATPVQAGVGPKGAEVLAKTKKGKKQPTVQPVDPAALPPEQQAAIAATQPDKTAPAPTPEDIVAAAQRAAAQVQKPEPQLTTPQPAPVPDQAAQAAQRVQPAPAPQPEPAPAPQPEPAPAPQPAPAPAPEPHPAQAPPVTPEVTPPQQATPEVRAPEPSPAPPKAATSPKAAEPAKPDTVRFYHGGKYGKEHGPADGMSKWLTPDETYARNYKSDGSPNEVYYVDIPKSEIPADAYDEVNGRYRHFNAPEEIAGRLKPLEEKPTGRVLPNVSPEAKKAQKAQNKKIAENAKEKEEASGERKRGPVEKAALEERAKHAEEVVKAHVPDDRPNDVPTSREGRDAMAGQLGKMLEDAASRGLVLREALPEAVRDKVFPKKRKSGEPLVKRETPTDEELRQGHLSIPKIVAKADGHVLYLREAASIWQLLSKKSPLTKGDKERIQKFIVEERGVKQGDAEMMRERRKEDGDLAKRKDQGDVEAVPKDKVAVGQGDADFAAGAREDTMSPEDKMIAHEEREIDPDEIVQGKSVKDVANVVNEKGKVDEAARAVPETTKVLSPREARKQALAGKGKPKQLSKPAEKIEQIKAKAKEPIPEATSAKVVDKAAEKTNTEPSDAQKEAGNYAKATVKWHGLEVAIENPKGSVRKGKSADGKEWSVEMPDHYGYIKRTEGADGDQVDVYMGPNPKSDDVWVIHQRDLEGNFDEHKAMLGYDSQADAMEAYDKAFSDGRGYERLGDMEHMTPDEFKQWVKSDKPKKAAKEGANESDSISAALRAPIESKFNPKGGGIEAIKKMSAREALRGLNLKHLNGVPAAIAKLAKKRFEALVGDTEVYLVSNNQMAHATGDFATAFADEPKMGVQGFANMRMFDGKVHIILRADQFHSPENTAHVVLHEIAHAATMRALTENKKLYDTVTRMMGETKDFLEHLPDVAKKLEYAMTDEREFVAEAFSNPEVQEVLAGIPMSPELAKEVGLYRGSTVWDLFVDTVRKAIEKITGRIPEGGRMIEGILRLGPEFDAHLNRIKSQQLRAARTFDTSLLDTRVKPHGAFAGAEDAAALMGKVKSKVDEILKHPDLQEQEGRPWLMGWRTMDQLAQLAREHGLPQVRRVADLMEMTRMKAAAYLKKSEPIVTKLHQLERKYKASGMWDKFTSLVHDETMANVFADRDLASQTHLGKDALKGQWGKAQHADLAKRFAEIPEDLRAARVEAMKFFTDQQNAMSLGIIKNRILKVLGVDDDALARRIHEECTVDTDADLVGGADTLKAIQEAKELAKIQGPYFPLMRRGDYVVSARHEIEAPANAKRLSDNEFEFSGKDARDQAIEFAKQQDTKPTIKSVWVDKATGETRFPEGDKVLKQDENSEQRFRVTVQNKHVEFHESRKSALARAAELEKHGLADVRTEQRKFEGGQGADLLSHQMQQLSDALKRRKSFNDLTPGQKNDVVQALNMASLKMLGSTRIQTKRLPRTYVEGASHDLTRNTWEYAQSTAGYLAKLEHQPQMDAALKAMNDGIRTDANKTSHLARSEIAHEINSRVDKQTYYEQGGKFSEATKRLMTLSFLDKLFSPAFNVINSLQPAMVTMPTLAGRYGVGRSFDAMARAYRDISSLNIVGKGIKDTVGKAKSADYEGTNFLDEIKGRLASSKEREMLDYVADRGSLDRESGMEIGKLIKAKSGVIGKLDTGIGYMEGVARQMPQAIEMMNRAVTALATYRLEMARGAKHEDAMVKAQEAVNNTQGLYSATNAAPIFNHPVAKISLQFKKYGQMMYHLLGYNIGKAMKGATKEERMEALKTLGGLVATHTAVAGALGLPTEPFKYLLLGANAAGLTSMGWGDVENKVREGAANAFGKPAGEILTKGLPHLLGIDLSSRVGLDSLTSFGEPRSFKDSDVKSWLFDTVAGAPVSLVADWVKGANALMSGNFEKAAELMVPNKFAADSLRAYREMTEGKKSASGRETMSPYNPLEAATRAFGFTPRRESEQASLNSAYYSASQSQKGERQGLVNDWVTAKPSDKTSAWSAIQKWNAGVPRDAKITLGELSSANKRRQTEARKGTVQGGLTVGKHDKYLLDRARSTYNP